MEMQSVSDTDVERDEQRGLMGRNNDIHGQEIQKIKQMLQQQKNNKRYFLWIIAILLLLVLVVIVFGIFNIISTSTSNSSSGSSSDAARIEDSMSTFNLTSTVLDGCNITTSDVFEFVILLDNSCGLNEEQCNIQLRAVSNLVASIKKSDSNPYISVIPMANINDNSQLSDVFIGFNAQNYQLNVDAYSEEIISNGPCGSGSSVFGSSPSLMYSINLAAIQLKYYGDPTIANQKIIVLSNCDALISNVAADSNQEICSQILNITELDDVDIHFINAPITMKDSDSISFRSQYPHQYISCMVGYDSSKITVVNTFDLNTFNNQISSALQSICHHDKAVVPLPTSEPIYYTMIEAETNFEPTIYPGTDSSECAADSCVSRQALNVTSRALPTKVLPGAQFLAYAFNMMTGKPPQDLLIEGNYRQILEFTFDYAQVSSGTQDYLVPDQMDLPSVSGICHKQSSSSSVSKSSSLSTLSRESTEQSDDTSASVGVGGGGYGASVSASVGMSLSHSNSQSSSNSRDQAKKR
eukprot:395123_1